MAKIKCISVRVKSMIEHSPKSFKITDFNGNTEFIPKSAVYGIDDSVTKVEAYWIAEWILKQKSLTHGQKESWFDREVKSGVTEFEGTTIERHIPDVIECEDKEIDSLKR